MFDVYIYDWKQDNGTIVAGPTKMFSIPSGGATIPVNNPVVRCGEDMADSFQFTMEPSSPYYDALIHMKTRFRIDYGTDTIFYGRVLTIKGSTVFQTKNVTCAGAFTFLGDTYYEGTQEKFLQNITLTAYLNKLFTNHNSIFANTETWKQINLGTIGFTPTTETRKYEPTSWSDTQGLIKGLTDNYGGHMKIRFTNNSLYLDWYKYYARDLGNGLRPSVSIGRNLLDISSDVAVDNIFTRLIPVGGTDSSGKTIYVDGCQYTDKNGTSHTHNEKYIPVTLLQGTNGLYTNVQLTDEFHNYEDYRDAQTNYGIIYKTQSFSNADKKEKLWEYAVDWIKNNYYGMVTSFSVKAIDMYITNQSDTRILMGDCVDVTYKIQRGNNLVTETKKLVCKSVQYDLFNPDKNSYTFGVPSDLLNHEYGQKKTKTKEDTVTSASANTYKPSGAKDTTWTFRKIANTILEQYPPGPYGGEAAYNSFVSNGPMSGSVQCYDPEETNDPSHHPEFVFTATIVGKITTVSGSTKWVAMSSERGLFGYVHMAYPDPIKYWYIKTKGYTYDDKIDPLIKDEAGIYTTADKSPEGEKTFLLEPTTLTGQGSQGEMKVGYDLTAAGDKWKIKLNVPLQYTDADGVTRIADGFVKASDFAVQEIPSFKTKIGIFDIVIAGKVQAQQIAADLAEVRKWLGDTIIAGTGIRTAKLYSSLITSNSYALPIDQGGGTYDTAYLQNCFSNCLASSSGGVISLSFYKIGGGLAQTVNFNMAATQFYQDAVAAAYREGYRDGEASASGGGIASITLKTPDSSGNPGYTWYTSMSIRNSAHRWINIKMDDGSGIYIDVN